MEVVHYARTMKKLLLLATFTGLATTLDAQSFFFSATLNGASERPTPNASTALGFGTVVLNVHNPADLSDDTLSYSVSYAGLSGPSTAAHIHGPADVNTAAGVIQGLTGDLGVTTGNFNVSNLALSPATATALENALLTQDVGGVSLGYLNVHSTVFPGGEIRGQLVQVAVVPEVDSAVFVGAALGLGALLWRRRQS
jgi:hypothetical protein